MSDGGNIKIYMRMRPSKRPSGWFTAHDDTNQLDFTIPVDATTDVINNTRTSYKFKFDGMFDMTTTQDTVFDTVAKEAVDSALDGFNATIFAYGQTGSGKTFTITGGAERYQDRGIIPRALSRVFQAFKDRPGVQYSAYISYLELYNEAGYDLLDPSHETKMLEELPRVTLMEDEEGNVHLKNLSMHPATNEEEALNLLFLGDTNRAIAETPMNLASSRSHCIFTISIESRQEGSPTIRRSKLHLVDLAGSERTHKTHSTGQLFREATNINKSLHFLEMVIVALQEAKKGTRTHIPYRNSLLTSVIRDSLGGNCKTSMIATINPEVEHTEESISTCRFAQRVARVQNSAIVNEETDPNILIRQLKAKLSGMQSEVQFLKGETGDDTPLTDADNDAVLAACRAFVHGPDDGELALGDFKMSRIKAAFAALRSIALELRGAAAGAGATAGAASGGAASGGAASSGSGAPPSPTRAAAGAGTDDAAAHHAEVRRLTAQLQQRDNEIAILVSMVKTAKAAAASAGAAGGATAGAAASPAVLAPSASLVGGAPSPLAAVAAGVSSGAYAPAAAVTAARVPTPLSSASSAASVGIMLADGSSQAISPDVLADKKKALEVFKASYPRQAAIDENKRVLKEKYDRAKTLAEMVNKCRDETNRLKGEIEKRRVERAMATIVEGGDGAAAASSATASSDDPAELALRAGMDAQKASYKTSFQELRDLKSEIEHIQKLLESGQLKLQADFESWYGNCLQRMGAGSGDSVASGTMGSTLADITSSASVGADGGAAGVPSSRASGSFSIASTAASLSRMDASFASTAASDPGVGTTASSFLGSARPPLPVVGAGHAAAPAAGGMPLYPLAHAGIAGAGTAMYPPPAGVTVGGYGMGTTFGIPYGGILPGQVTLPAMPGHGYPAFGMGPAIAPPAGASGGSITVGLPSYTPTAGAVTARAPPGAAVPGSSGGITLTGNADADADILAFYKAKEELLRRTKGAGAAGGGAAGGPSVGGYTGGFAAVLAEASSVSAGLRTSAGSVVPPKP